MNSSKKWSNKNSIENKLKMVDNDQKIWSNLTFLIDFIFNLLIDIFNILNKLLINFLIKNVQNQLKINQKGNLSKWSKKIKNWSSLIGYQHHPLIRIRFWHRILNRTEFRWQICHRTARFDSTTEITYAYKNPWHC